MSETPGATPACTVGQHIPGFLSELRTIAPAVREIVQLLKRETRLSNLDVPAAVGANFQPYTIAPAGRHYVYVWAPAATTLAIAGLADAGTFNLNTGWQALNLPAGTRISSSGAGQTNLIVRYTDDPFGGL